MRREILLLAESIAPGATGVALQAALIAAWSLAEAENDWKLIENGERVAFIKGSGNLYLRVGFICKTEINGSTTTLWHKVICKVQSVYYLGRIHVLNRFI